MLKNILIASLMLLFSCQGWCNIFQYKEENNKLSKNEHQLDLGDQKKTINESPLKAGKFEPTGGAAKNAIDLALAPEWTRVSDTTDKERAGYKQYEIYCHHCKKQTSMDSELADKFKK